MIRVLIAAVDSAPGGYTWTIPGEFVMRGPMGFTGWLGMASTRGCTLAEVAELDTDGGMVSSLIREWLVKTGYTIDDVNRLLPGMLADTLRIAAGHPLGSQLRRYRADIMVAV